MSYFRLMMLFMNDSKGESLFLLTINLKTNRETLNVSRFQQQQESCTASINGLLDMPNHGLRTLDETFFHRNPNLFGLSRQIRQINFGTFGFFSANLSAPPVHVFH